MEINIVERVLRLKENIAKIAEKANRNADEIELIAVSKTKPIERIIEVQNAGVYLFGENRAQELIEKSIESIEDVRWHFIGHLQTNKIKKIVDIAEMIQSIDSLHLAEEVSRIASNKGISVDVLLQVNTSEEASKFGFNSDQVIEMCEHISRLSSINVLGLMTIAPFTNKVRVVAKCFSDLRILFEKIKKQNIENIKMKYLSMGMTNDYEVAIKEGSNILRIGTAIFGPRN